MPTDQNPKPLKPNHPDFHPIMVCQAHRFIRRRGSKGGCDLCGNDKKSHHEAFPSHNAKPEVEAGDETDAGQNEWGTVVRDAYQPLP